MSCPGVSFKELKLIVVAECVIFPWSLIGATMQDGGKRERRNVTSYCVSHCINLVTYSLIVYKRDIKTMSSRSFCLGF